MSPDVELAPIGWNDNRRSRWQTAASRVAKATAAVLLLVSAVTIASDPQGEDAAIAGTELPPNFDTPDPATEAGVALTPDLPGLGGSGSFSSDGVADSSPTTGLAGGTGDSGSTTGGAPGPVGDPSVAVISPTLSFLTFGSSVGLPLACGVASGLIASSVPDPNVAATITTITTSCKDYGASGSEAIKQLDTALGALAATNPATVPAIEAFASILDGLAQPGVPFLRFLNQLGSLIRFFKG